MYPELFRPSSLTTTIHKYKTKVLTRSHTLTFELLSGMIAQAVKCFSTATLCAENLAGYSLISWYASNLHKCYVCQGGHEPSISSLATATQSPTGANTQDLSVSVSTIRTLALTLRLPSPVTWLRYCELFAISLNIRSTRIELIKHDIKQAPHNVYLNLVLQRLYKFDRNTNQDVHKDGYYIKVSIHNPYLRP